MKTFLIILSMLLFLSACGSNTMLNNNAISNSRNNNINVSNSGNSNVITTPSSTNVNTANTSPSNTTNTSSSNAAQIGKFNPYKGLMADLFPKQISGPNESWIIFTDAKLDNSQGLSYLKALYGQLPKGASAPKSDDDYKGGFLLTIRNYPTADEANAALQTEADSRKNSVGVKNKNGKAVGKEILTGDLKVLIWTDGSLLMSLSSIRDSKREDIERVGYNASLLIPL